MRPDSTVRKPDVGIRARFYTTGCGEALRQYVDTQDETT
jgi:hypothetical protein